MAPKSYYDILEVHPIADASTIRAAYLRLSLAYHPDKNPGNEKEAKAKFIEIGRAYETLSDPEKRAMYDERLKSGGFRSYMPNFTPPGSFQKYSDAYDETRNERYRAAVGVAATVGSVVGWAVGRRIGGGCGTIKGALGGIAGGIVGSSLGTEVAVTSTKALQQNSVEKIESKEARDWRTKLEDTRDMVTDTVRNTGNRVQRKLARRSSRYLD